MYDLNKIEEKSILVIGDVMLDVYYDGEVKRISPEAPVPVFRKHSERSTAGGAANVAVNLAAAGQKVSILTILGKDNAGEKLKTLFGTNDINMDLVFELDRDTTVKTRFLASNHQQVMRLDVEDTQTLTQTEAELLLNSLKEKVQAYDLIVMSDYMKGLLSQEVTQGILALARRTGVPVIVDVKDPEAEKYEGAYLLKPNLNELRQMTGMRIETEEEIVEASELLRKRCGCEYVLTTCGAKGMVLVGKEEAPYFVKARGREVFDVTGAGDTAIAYLAAGMANNLYIRDAVYIANCASGLQVAKVGTSSVSWGEVRTYLAEEKVDTAYKVIEGTMVRNFRTSHPDKKIVFTNGCFDILHTGHIRYLREAARLGDILIVGLNSDASVKRLKGPDRPVNQVEDRAELLCALEFVDYVVVFEEDTPYQLIRMIQPDILTKGGDYAPDEVVGKDIVEERGGRLVLIPFVDGKSTSGMIQRIRS